MYTLEIAGFTALPGSSLRAVQFLRKMRGGAQSSLLQAEDGKHYIVKLPGNPQGTETLFNEAFASELMRIAGFPVPTWRRIEVSEEFLSANRGVWFETSGSGRQRPQAGLGFGSSLITAGEGEELYEILPASWMGVITNRADFIGVLLFDFWINQADCRQAIFLQDRRTRAIRATFIDQGCTLSKLNLRVEIGKIRGMCLDRRIYETVDIKAAVAKWKARIEGIDEGTLRALLSRMSIPEPWCSVSDIEEKLTGLLARQALLDRFAACMEASLSARTSELRQQTGRFPTAHLWRLPQLSAHR